MTADLSDDVVIHSVHGTYPYGLGQQWKLSKGQHDASFYKRDNIPWFYEQSEFAQAILKTRPARWQPFLWDGCNSFASRRDAAEAFASQLHDSLQKSAGRHIIIAHSHGGTVAAAAFAWLSDEDMSRIEGLVTMGTPFITMRWTQRSLLSDVRFFATRFTPYALLLYVILFVIACRIEPSRVWSTSLSLFVPSLVALFFAATSERLMGAIFGARKGAGTYIDIFNPQKLLRRSIVALRAPGDEAGLAIGAAQTLDFFAGLVWHYFIYVPAGMLNRFLTWTQMTWARRCLLVIGLLVAGAILPLLSGALTSQDFKAPWVAAAAKISLAAVLGAGQLLIYFLVTIGILALLTSLIIAPGVALLALGSGREVLGAAGLLEVECEPVPSGMRAVVETLPFSLQEMDTLSQRGSLRHSFYELPAARQRVAALIEEWTTPWGDAARDIRNGGRVRELRYDLWEEQHRGTLAAGGRAAHELFSQLLGSVAKSRNEEALTTFEARFVQLLPKPEQARVQAQVDSAKLDLLGDAIAEIGRRLNASS